MAGGARIGFGYAFLTLGLLLSLTGGVLAGMDIDASASQERCQDGLLTGERCESQEASFDADAIGGFLLVPGAVFVAVSIPLLVTGHRARDEEQRSDVSVHVEQGGR